MRAARGQGTIEFILVMVVALAFIAAVVQPNADYSSNSIEDVANIAKLRASADRVANAIQYISIAGPGSRQSVQAVIPAGAQITCNSITDTPPNSILFIYTLKSKESTTGCSNDADNEPDICSKAIAAGSQFSCTDELDTQITQFGPGIYNVKVSKDETTSAITVKFSVVQ